MRSIDNGSVTLILAKKETLPMRIVVLNGSPRGKKSISRKASMILEKLYPQHAFEFLDVAPSIGRWERDEAA